MEAGSRHGIGNWGALLLGYSVVKFLKAEKELQIAGPGEGLCKVKKGILSITELLY